MLQSRIFRSNSGFDLLEEKVNKWLEGNPAIEIKAIQYQDNLKYCSVFMVFDRKV